MTKLGGSPNTSSTGLGMGLTPSGQSATPNKTKTLHVLATPNSHGGSPSSPPLLPSIQTGSKETRFEGEEVCISSPLCNPASGDRDNRDGRDANRGDNRDRENRERGPGAKNSLAPTGWGQQQVREWLCSIGLEKCAGVFDAEGIDGSVLLNLGPLEIQELVPEEHRAVFETALRRLYSPSSSSLPGNLGDWTTEHVIVWLRSLGMESYCEVVRDKRLSGFNLYYLTKRIMKEQLGIHRLGDRVKLSTELNKLRESFNPDMVSVQDIRKRIEQVEMKCELVNVNTDTKQVSLNTKNWLAMKNTSSRSSYTPVLTFVGPTGCGKSTLLTEFLSIPERELKGGPLIAQPGQVQPTTGNIQAFVGEGIVPGIPKIRLLDMEGEGGRMPLTLVERFNSRAERYRRGMQRIYKHRIKVFRSGLESNTSDNQAIEQELAKHEKERKKEFTERYNIVGERFPQLAYMISDVLIYVDVHPMHDRKYLTRVREFAKRSNQQNASTDKPFLILVQNKADDLSTLEIRETTDQFFIAAKEDPELDAFLNCFRDIYFIKVPHRRHSPEEYCSQVESFRYLIGQLLCNPASLHMGIVAPFSKPSDLVSESPPPSPQLSLLSNIPEMDPSAFSASSSFNAGTAVAGIPPDGFATAEPAAPSDTIDPHFFNEYVWFDVLAEIIKQFPDILSKSEALSKVCRPASDLHEKVFSFFEIFYNPAALLPPSWDRTSEADCLLFVEERKRAFLEARRVSISKLAAEIVPGFKQRWGVDSSRHPFYQTVKVENVLRETLESLLSLIEKRQPCLAFQGRKACTQEFMLHSDHRCYGSVWKGDPCFDSADTSREELFQHFFAEVRAFTDLSDQQFLQKSLEMLQAMTYPDRTRSNCCLICLTKQNNSLLSCEHSFCQGCVEKLASISSLQLNPPTSVPAIGRIGIPEHSLQISCPLCKKGSSILNNHDRLPGISGARIIALDGGGVRGLVLNEIMLALCSRNGRHPSELFDLIVGTSTGSIIACLWGLVRMPLEDIKKAYLQFPGRIFKRRPAHRAIGRTAYTWWNSKPPYKHKDLARELTAFYGDSSFLDYAEDPRFPKVAVVASEIIDESDLRPYLFGNYSPAGRVEAIDYPLDYWHSLVEAGCCSSSAPTYFKQMTLGTHSFVDGGLTNNNPTLVALKEASVIWKDRPIDIVISLGTGLKKRLFKAPPALVSQQSFEPPSPSPLPYSGSMRNMRSTPSATGLEAQLFRQGSAQTLPQKASSSSSSSSSKKAPKSKKADDGLVTWVERMIELATGTEHHHYQVLRTLSEHIPYFRLNPEGLGSYPLDSTSSKILNEICAKTREWCQQPDVSADLDRISDLLFAKGFYVGGPHVVEARVETDCRFIICSRTPLGISKDLRFHIQMGLHRPSAVSPTQDAIPKSARDRSISRSLREGLDDPANSIGLVTKYDAQTQTVEVKFFASVAGDYQCEVRVIMPSGEELPISGQPWEMHVLPPKEVNIEPDDILKDLSWTSFVLSVKQFDDQELLASGDIGVHQRRVTERLSLLNLKEHGIAQDPSCLFAAVSSQVYGDFSHASAVRKGTANWLEANEVWELENGQHICQYVEDRSYRDYIAALRQKDTWGDHLGLIAVSQLFGARVIVVTSVVGEECLLDIEPILKKTERVIRLCHWGSRNFSGVLSGSSASWTADPQAGADQEIPDMVRVSSPIPSSSSSASPSSSSKYQISKTRSLKKRPHRRSSKSKDTT